jgi:uncharacterized protein YigA (DUF484 family)
MSTDSISAEDIALFLQENPDFLQEHADLFAGLRVPHPHEARAISLGERQILTLRTKAKDLEWKLSTLVQNAAANEKISKSLHAWCARMLAERDPALLPSHVVQSLGGLFELPGIALRLWDVPVLGDSDYTQGVDNLVKDFAGALGQPYCGPLRGQQVASWLETAPASLAIVALRPPGSQTPFGLLVLGSDDAQRFGEDMGTAFLDTLGQLAGAALSRLRAAS